MQFLACKKISFKILIFTFIISHKQGPSINDVTHLGGVRGVGNL